MSKKYILAIISLSILLFFGTNLFVSKNVEANVFSFKWTTTNSNGAVVKVRNANLDSDYSKAVIPGYNKWNKSSARITVSSSSTPERGVISLQQQTKGFFKDNGWGATIEAWAMPFNIDSSVPYCVTNPNGEFLSECKNKVTSGVVWINSGEASSDASRREAVIAHEIGHMIGLGHQKMPTTKYSIMANNLIRGYEVTGYDTNNVNSLY